MGKIKLKGMVSCVSEIRTDGLHLTDLFGGCHARRSRSLPSAPRTSTFVYHHSLLPKELAFIKKIHHPHRFNSLLGTHGAEEKQNKTRKGQG